MNLCTLIGICLLIVQGGFQTIDEQINMANDLRHMVAKAAHIPKMADLSYDPDLERQAKSITCEHHPTGSFTFFPAPSETELSTIFMAHSQRNKTYLATLPKKYPKFFDPDQTKIGCDFLKRKCFPFACLLGPKSDAQNSSSAVFSISPIFILIVTFSLF